MKTTRNTTAKTAVLEVFENSKTALSHTEIQKQLNDVCDRVTIYRILDRLVNDDIIHKISNLDGTVKYAKMQSFASARAHSQSCTLQL